MDPRIRKDDISMNRVGVRNRNRAELTLPAKATLPLQKGTGNREQGTVQNREEHGLKTVLHRQSQNRARFKNSATQEQRGTRFKNSATQDCYSSIFNLKSSILHLTSSIFHSEPF
jgi:hypothetical protein